MVSLRTAETAINSVKKYTSNGGRLVSKDTGLKLDENLKGIAKKIPQNAETLDIVKLETDFGASSQRILSFRDKTGKLIKRIVSKYKGNNLTSKTTNTYNYSYDNYRTVSRQTHSNGKMVQEVREQFALNPKANNLLGHTKLTVTKDNQNARHEHQVFETFTKKSQDRTYLETNAQRDSKGRMVKKTLKGNIKDLDSLKSDPYLYIRNYNDNDFLKATSSYAKKVQQVEDRSIDIVNKEIGSLIYGDSKSSRFEKRVRVSVAQHDSRGEVIDTINHELRHQYQDKLIETQGLTNYTLNRDSSKLTKEENKLARAFRKAHRKYTTKDSVKYYNNLLEVDAREAGEKAKKVYDDSSKKLLNKFPKADPRLFGLPKVPSISETVKKMLNKLPGSTKINIGIFGDDKIANITNSAKNITKS